MSVRIFDLPDDVFQYQDDAARIMASRERFGLFDGMGVGKTATGIRAADHAQAVKGIVFCPAAIRENWKQEFIRFQHTSRRIIKIDSEYDLKAWLIGHYDVALISFERASSMRHIFARHKVIYDFAIIDEGHYLKSETSSRAQHILGPEFDGIGGVLQYAAQAWWLTGTPAPNDPSDLWTWLRFVGATKLNKTAFKAKYFSTTVTTYGSKSRPREGALLNELRQIIEANSIARSMADVGIFLPPIWLTNKVLECDTNEIAAYLDMLPGLDQKLLAMIEQGGDLAGIEEEHVAALRRLIGEAKAIPYANFLLNDLRSGLDKVVVFGHHRGPLNTIKEFIERRSNSIECVIIQGGVDEQTRTDAVRRFNTDPNCRVFLGNHRAAGVGLNLQAQCASVDIFESDWTPTANAQSVRRVARFGQTRQTQARFVTTNHWLEEAIEKANKDKTSRILSLGLPELL